MSAVAQPLPANKVVRCPHCQKPLFSVDDTGRRILIRCGGCSTDHAIMALPPQMVFVQGAPFGRPSGG